MGQQQLLLVILVTIIVGIATVVAINTFGAAADSATVDAVRQDLATIGASAQGFYMKPAMLGGGGRTFDGSSSDAADGITWGDIAFGGTENTDGNMQNENAIYVMGVPAATDFTVTATAFTSDSTIIAARICPDDIIMGQEGEAATSLAAC
ncbi:MAG: hypothetical protein WD315_03295 [Balneolaceae bacterium]